MDDWTTQIKGIDNADFAVSDAAAETLNRGIQALVEAFNSLKAKVDTLGAYESPGQEALATQVRNILKDDTVGTKERLDKYRDYLLELASAMNLSVQHFISQDKLGLNAPPVTYGPHVPR
ncbi:hypothetical protein [Mycobacteroides chelonae]|uniref:hypothetical protein n=1 Tax=Mycobacteroides chelonae TaxID=1774 RepID=UPI0012FFBD06|nr:hypothetical protein [Mycobacteroides chelonae]